MIANSSVRPRVAAVANAGLIALALTFFCLPVRAEKQEPVGQIQQQQPDKAEVPAKTEQEIAELRTISRNNLKQIMLALHNYHDRHNIFPPAMLFGKDNKGGTYPHSWRVALLPYLDQAKLYEQYKFDEAWDSPANKLVLSQMPDVFRAPAADKKSADTSYVVFVGKLLDDDSDNKPLKLESMFSSRAGVRLRSITDGTSNTLAVLETKRDGKDAIPWTRPTDIEFDPAKPLPKLGGLYDDGFYIGMCDGSVRYVASTLPEATVKLLITPTDGKPLPAF